MCQKSSRTDRIQKRRSFQVNLILSFGHNLISIKQSISGHRFSADKHETAHLGHRHKSACCGGLLVSIKGAHSRKLCFFCARNRLFFDGVTVHYCTFSPTFLIVGEEWPNGRAPQRFPTESILSARKLRQKQIERWATLKMDLKQK